MAEMRGDYGVQAQGKQMAKPSRSTTMPGRSGTSTFCRDVILKGGGSREREQCGKRKTGIVITGPVRAALVSKLFPGYLALHCRH
jgi:hypothetical protein